MALPIRDRYYLRSMHQEIDLFDRKLAHLLKHEVFASAEARASAADKLSSKRDQLVRAARGLAESGVAFRASELPRSLRPSPGEAGPETASGTCLS